jgi:type IV pilus assembly protein PilM
MTKFLSMDIGSRYIHIVEGFGNKAATEIKTAYLVDTPLDAVDNGKIVDEPALTQVLRTALSQQRPSTKKAILTIQSTQVISRDFSIPVLKNSSELSNAVSFEMEQYLPSTADDYLIEYYIVEEFEEEGVKYYKIRAAAMPKEIADGYYRLVKGLKLTPVALDIHSNAITKLFSNDVVINGREYPRDKSYALIDIGCKFTALNIISGGKLEISRIISIGGRDIDTAIAPYFNLPLEKTEQKRCKLFWGRKKNLKKRYPKTSL